MEHKLEYRKCEVADLFSIHGDSDEVQAVINASAEYLTQFVAPVKVEGKPACFHCGERFDSFLQCVGAGVAYEWGMVHGEARCSGCKWPARGMHYPKDTDGKELWKAQNLFLAYHPDFVNFKSETETRDTGGPNV